MLQTNGPSGEIAIVSTGHANDQWVLYKMPMFFKPYIYTTSLDTVYTILTMSSGKNNKLN